MADDVERKTVGGDGERGGAMTGMDKPVIWEFKGAYRFLSNFFIEPDGTCVEVEYQRSKCRDNSDIPRFEGLTPAQAKHLGKQVSLRAYWTAVRVAVMRPLVFGKFYDHPTLAHLLLSTGEAELIEGNHWGDHFWGRVDGGHGMGENWLGRILMETRESMRIIAKTKRAGVHNFRCLCGANISTANTTGKCWDCRRSWELDADGGYDPPMKEALRP